MYDDDSKTELARRFARSKINKRPRILYAAVLGTFICFVLFVRHYMEASDDSVIWIWFGIRSDGRCGRDYGSDSFKETKCGHGMCCSSHGWCGFGEDYCSVALGCQSGCDPVDEDEQKRIDEQKAHDPELDHHGIPDDDDDYHSRMRHYRYDDDYHGGHGYGRGYRGDYHDEHHYDDYHHRYDDGIEHDLDHDDGYHGSYHRGYHHEDDYGDHAYEDAHNAELHDADADADADEGVELVGLHEKQHLGDGDGVPLESADAE